MIHKREAFKIVVLEPAKSRIAERQCPVCEMPRSKWKAGRLIRWTCSAKCNRVFWKKHAIFGWADLRGKVFDRDNNTCSNCGLKCLASDLVADHIRPIALGGAQWEMDNIQTLCGACNRIKTKKDAADIARQRRHDKFWGTTGQQSLNRANIIRA